MPLGWRRGGLLGRRGGDPLGEADRSAGVRCWDRPRRSGDLDLPFPPFDFPLPPRLPPLLLYPRSEPFFVGSCMNAHESPREQEPCLTQEWQSPLAAGLALA